LSFSCKAFVACIRIRRPLTDHTNQHEDHKDDKLPRRAI
jgi:hypothetical protein